MIIQSFWSKPFLNDSKDPNSRFKGGWLSEKYFYYSMTLSCLKFKQYYGHVKLYTDKAGEEILSGKLGIPYSEYDNRLNLLDEYPEKLWAFPKLYCYQLQTEPFIHADTDVFIWEKFPETLTGSALFCQNIEENFPIYGDALNEILAIFNWVPTELINTLYKYKGVKAFNAGIIGGTNLDYFKELYARSEKFIQRNLDKFEDIDVGIFNMIYEQQLGYAIAEKRNITPECLFDDVDANFTRLTNFHLAPFLYRYVHAIGMAKKSQHACEQIEALLMYEFPEEYQKVRANGEKHLLWKPGYEISERRKEFLFSMFRFVREKSDSDICKLRFHINPTVKITEGEPIQVTFTSPQKSIEETIELNDWDNMLLYFEESMSIDELSRELMLDDDISSKYTPRQLQEKLMSFVFDKCLLHELLIPEF
ncbi:DUF6734 family protein [Flavobacterium silvaticum]|uniref:DUF6734 domain-containing protein n=1 Tax=Flavobacterium silvaticum TaxID=1852020 RepID=A0A972FT59_9FLAO|nr:DUF6734 family protein [Flavobacterium silvaticum]NMH28013.1 hypothetical protein [Flavobacterium silvaticum]